MVKITQLCPTIRLSRPLKTAYFSIDGHQIVTFSEDEQAEVWEVATGLPMHGYIPTLFVPLTQLRYDYRSPEKVLLPYIFETKNYRTIVKSAKTNEPISQKDFPSEFDYCTSVSPNGAFIANGDSSGYLSVLDVKAERMVQLYGHDTNMNNHMHQNSICYLEFNHESRVLVSVSEEERYPRLWPNLGQWEKTVANGELTTHCVNSSRIERTADFARFSPTSETIMLSTTAYHNGGMVVDVYQYSF